MIISPFPLLDFDDWMAAQFVLIYSQYGGSGLQVGYRDVQEMSIPEIFWFIKKLNETREVEAVELAKAGRR